MLVMSISLMNRNPLLVYGGDEMAHVILFWCMFLPLSYAWSLESALTSKKLDKKTLFSSATLALTLQVIFIYVFSGLMKANQIWLGEGSALEYIFNAKQFAKPLAHVLLDFPETLKVLSKGTVLLEIFAPPLLLFVFAKEKIRLGLVAVFIFFHISIFATLDVGLFSWIAISMWLIFLPTMFWDFFLQRRSKSLIQYKIYFDRNCGFCLKGVLILREFLGIEDVEVMPGQSNHKIEEKMNQAHSWVVHDDKGKLHTHFQAFLVLLQASSWPKIIHRILSLPFSKKIGHQIYLWVSRHRSVWSKITASFHIKERSFNLHKLTRLFLMLFLLETFLVNIQSLERKKIIDRATIKPLLMGNKDVRNLTGWHQNWHMFAPNPKVYEGWYVIQGVDKSENPINIWGTDDLTEPVSIPKTFINHRWSKYMRNLSYDQYKSYRPHFAHYLCREHKLLEIEINFIHRKIKPKVSYEKNALWQGKCL